jgi:hypothetical protein
MRLKSFKLFVESLIFDKYEIDKLADLILGKQEELASNLMKAGLEDSEVLFEELADSIIQKRLIDKVTNYNEIQKFEPKFHFHHTYFGKNFKVFDPFKIFSEAREIHEVESNFKYGLFVIIIARGVCNVQIVIPMLVRGQLIFKTDRFREQDINLSTDPQTVIKFVNEKIDFFNENIQSPEFKANLIKTIKKFTIGKQHKTKKLVTVEDLEDLGVTENIGQIMGQFFKQYAQQMNELKKLDYSDARQQALKLLSNFVDTL